MNIIVIMLDSLRPDYLGCYGNNEVKSPAINKIASEGIIFTRAYAEFPITIPSRTAFLCGIYTHTNRPWMKPRRDDPRLPNLLRMKGYRTAAIGDTVLTWGHLDDLGFDHFKGYRFGKCGRPKNPDRNVDVSGAFFPPECNEAEHRIYRNTIQSQLEGLESMGKKSPEVVTDATLQWIEDHKDEKFFIWIDYFEPHEPWEAPTEFIDMHDLDPEGRFIPMPPRGPHSLTEKDLNNILVHYKATITQMDCEIARIEEHLDKLGLKEDTLIVITSDHGEPFGEHGTIRKYGVPMYEELSRIVLIMRNPGLIPRKQKEDALVLNVDLPVTFTSMIDASEPERFEGLSLLPIIRGESKAVRDKAFIGAFNLHSAVTTPRWKFIDKRGEKENELYDLQEDPAEKTNLVKEKNDLARRLHREIWEFNRHWSFSLAWRDHPLAPR